MYLDDDVNKGAALVPTAEPPAPKPKPRLKKRVSFKFVAVVRKYLKNNTKHNFYDID